MAGAEMLRGGLPTRPDLSDQRGLNLMSLGGGEAPKRPTGLLGNPAAPAEGGNKLAELYGQFMAEEMGPQQPSLEQAVQKVGLLNMKLSELRAYAIEAGVPAAAMQAALEASGEQANALATLILQQQAVRAAPMPPPTAGVVEKDTPAPWAADSAALSMSGLRRRAAAAGVTPEQLDAACDDADPKQRVIEHIMARIEHFRSLKLSQLRKLAEGQPNARHPDAPWHGAGHSGDTTDDAIFSEKQPKEHAIALILNPVRNVDVAAPAKQLPANPENLSQIPSLRPQTDAGRILRT